MNGLYWAEMNPDTMKIFAIGRKHRFDFFLHVFGLYCLYLADRRYIYLNISDNGETLSKCWKSYKGRFAHGQLLKHIYAMNLLDAVFSSFSRLGGGSTGCLIRNYAGHRI